MTDQERKAVSVLLPTLEWGPACDELANQIDEKDELFLICDTDSDPIASRDTPPDVEVLAAGEPTGCSGKANALAYAMERARHDRFVWSDADYERDGDWLDRLVEAGEEHGPAAVQPMFSGDGWWRLVEPIFVLILSLRAGFFWGNGDDGYPWGVV